MIVSITLDKFHFSRNSAAPFHDCNRISLSTRLVPFDKRNQHHRRSFLPSKFHGFHSRFSILAFPPISTPVSIRQTIVNRWSIRDCYRLESVDLKRAREWKTRTIYNGQWYDSNRNVLSLSLSRGETKWWIREILFVTATNFNDQFGLDFVSWKLAIREWNCTIDG